MTSARPHRQWGRGSKVSACCSGLHWQRHLLALSLQGAGMFCVELREAWKDIALLGHELQVALMGCGAEWLEPLQKKTAWLLSRLWDPEQVSWPLRASLPHL